MQIKNPPIILRNYNREERNATPALTNFLQEDRSLSKLSFVNQTRLK